MQLRDTLTRRFAQAIGLAVAVAFALNGVLTVLDGTWARPSPEELQVPEQAATIIRMIDAAPPSLREQLARKVAGQAFAASYWGATPPLPPEAAETKKQRDPEARVDAALGGWPGAIVFFGSKDQRRFAGPIRAEIEAHPNGTFLQVELHDGTWLLFSAPEKVWGPGPVVRATMRLAVLLVSIAVIALVGARRLARPMHDFAAAARRFGTDPHATPMASRGPAELRLAIGAFNEMQSQIQRAVAGQAAVFAAISHDIRAPLTRIRLRGEFIQDPQQQVRLFRDVDEMQTMVAAALAFLRDNATGEETTSLDLPELLRTIVDDFSDLGTEVAYAGPDRLAFPGRPVGLKRAFGNLVDNATRYGGKPAIAMWVAAGSIVVDVTDDGEGIPEAMLAKVFTPFQRAQSSRDSNITGMGLGLTAARSAFRAHGGDVVLLNRAEGGLLARVTLPG